MTRRPQCILSSNEISLSVLCDLQRSPFEVAAPLECVAAIERHRFGDPLL